MTRRLATIAGIIVLVVVGVAGAWMGWSRRGGESVVVASVGTVAQTVVATGRVAPVTEVVVANKIPGRIKAVLVREGDVVRRGQPVVQFDDGEAQADLRTMEARVTGARAEVRRAQASVESARARWMEIKAVRPQEVERARAEVLQAKERWDNAELERTRFDQLLKNGHVARQQRDSVATEAEVAKARLRSAQETLNLVQAGAKAETVASAWAQVQETESELRRAESQVPLAIAELERARATLRTGTVESTINGKVTKKMVEPGEAVDIGTPLIVLADVSRVIIKAEIDETDVGKLRQGQNANVTSDAFPGRVFPATIYEIGQAVGKRKIRPDDLVKMGDMKVLETKLEVTQGGEDLKLGMTVDVKVLVAQKDKVLVIPKHLVQVGKKEATVAVKGPKGLDNRRITLGIWDDARVEVTGGLSPGDRILVRRPPSP